MIKHTEEVVTFQKRIKELKAEWMKIFQERKNNTNEPKPPPQPLPKPLGHGLRTPQKSYRLPILEVLEELGGSAPVNKILDRVYEKMKDRLSEYDRERLPSGASRWRKAAEWCRYFMVKEGLQASDSPQGIWEITSAGKVELFR